MQPGYDPVVPSLRATLASLGLSLGATAGCAEPACRFDVDCAGLERCEEGVCVPIDLEAVRDGACAGDADCSAGERCFEGRCTVLAAASPCSRELDEACAGGTCTVVAGARCTGDGCTVPLSCAPVAGERPGLLPCDADGDCQSGVCAGGSCFRACVNDIACPPGFACGVVTLGDGRRATGCVGADDPGLTTCRGPRDCTAPRVCRFLEEEPSERRMLPVCQVPPATVDRGDFDLCDRLEEHGVCPGGYCGEKCQKGNVQVCYDGQDRCTVPCETTDDCPAPYVCKEHFREDWLTDGRRLAFCQLAEEGCLDQLHCCPSVDGAGRCVGGWTDEGGACGIAYLGERLYTLCHPHTGAGPGGPCAADADCSSALCLPSPGGGRFCSSPCLLEIDRCDEQLEPGTVCRPMGFASEGATVSIPVCQAPDAG